MNWSCKQPNPDIANALALGKPNLNSERWRVRRDGWITILRDDAEEEWFVDPCVVKTCESTGRWPTITESETRTARESDSFHLYGRRPSAEGGFLSAPLTIQWDITSGCNLRCKHCYSSSAKKAPDELTTKEALRIVEEAYDIEVHSLHILGGEAFFRSDLISVLQEACRRGLRCHVSSNGTLIDSRMADALSRLPGLIVDVSLDSFEPERHDWLRGKGVRLNKIEIMSVDAFEFIRRPFCGEGRMILKEEIPDKRYIRPP